MTSHGEASPKFELDEETESRLLALYTASPDQLDRVRRRVAKAKENRARIEALLWQRERLRQRNSALAETANAASNGGAEEGSEEGPRLTRSPRPSNDNRPSPSFPSRRAPDRDGLRPHVPPSPGGGNSGHDETWGGPVKEGWARGSHPYQYGGPTGVTGAVSAVFPEGQLFRIVTNANEWAFYNDTRNYEMHVRYVLDARSKVAAAAPVKGGGEGGGGGRGAESARVTSSRKVTRLANGQWEVSVVVPPEETAVLFYGTVCGFEEKCSAVLLSFGKDSSGGGGGGHSSTDEATERYLCKEAWEAWEAIQQEAARQSPQSSGGVGNRGLPVRPVIAPLGEVTTSPASVAAAEAVLELCMQSKLSFVDPSFFPSTARLFRGDVDAFAIAPLHWRPPRAYLPARAHGEEALFLGSRLSPSGMQGGALLPDHNVLSAIAVLTRLQSSPAEEHPHAVTSLFTHPEAAAALLDTNCRREKSDAARSVAEMEQMLGAYRVQLCLSGWWRSFLVDAHVPAAQHRPEFARCSDDLRALWLPLLEKAYAKAFGSYSAILEASVPDVMANLTGSLCCSLASVWPPPSVGKTGATATATAAAAEAEEEAARKGVAFAKLVKRHVQAQRGGRLLLRAFPLSLAKSKGKRDRLEEIYRTLGLVPGCTVLAIAVEELTTGHTVVKLQQNSKDAGGCEACLGFWRQLGKPWVDALWELELTMEASGGGDRNALWMDLADVPQYFQEGFFLYPTIAEWTGGEVRAKGRFAGKDGVPSVALRLAVTAPTTVVVSVTQTEQRLQRTRCRLNGSFSDEEADDACGGGRASASASFSATCDAAVDVRGLALQVLGRERSGYALLSNSASPDVYATGEELQFAFHRDAGVALELTPDHSPYYVVPRVSPPTDTKGDNSHVPYVLSVLAKTAAIGSPEGPPGAAAAATALSVSFVAVSSSTKLLRQYNTPLGRTTAWNPSTDVEETAAEYQQCHRGDGQRLLVHNKRIDVI